jgi:hypothetical protein
LSSSSSAATVAIAAASLTRVQRLSSCQGLSLVAFHPHFSRWGAPLAGGSSAAAPALREGDTVLSHFWEAHVDPQAGVFCS